MKFRTRLLATTCSMAVAATMLSATMASADTEYTAASISTAPAMRRYSYDLKMSEAYSSLKDLPDEPTVGVSVQMINYNYRDPMSGEDGYMSTGNTSTTKSATYVNGEKVYFKIDQSKWAYFYVHGATISQDADGNQMTNKKGTSNATIAVSQPGGSYVYYDADGNDVTSTIDPDNVPEGVTTYYVEAELKDAVITGSGTYKAAIVGHDFSNDTNSNGYTGFNYLQLTSNIGYFNGKVNNKTYTVSDADLQTAITEAEAYITTLEEKIAELKAGDEETTTEAEETTTEAEAEAESEETTEEVTTEETTEAEDTGDNAGLIATYEGYIENIQSAIDTAKEAATKSGTKLATDYSLQISSMKINMYDSAESYEAGTPDRTTDVTGWITSGLNGNEEGLKTAVDWTSDEATETYNEFTEYRMLNIYTSTTDLDLSTTPDATALDDLGRVKSYITGTLSENNNNGAPFLTVTGLDEAGTGTTSSPKGATTELPKYALEVEFVVDEGDADVFGYQGAIDAAQVAVQTAVQEAGGLVWSDLEAAIEKAATYDSASYTSDSYATLTAAVTAAKELLAKYEADSSSVTQDEINAATAAIVSAIDGLEPIATDPGDTDDDDDDDDDDDTNSNSSSDTSSPTTTTTTGSDSNPSTGTGVAVTAATALLVGAGYVISRKRK